MTLLFKIFTIFFKIGLFTCGGGYAMLPLIQEEVLAQGWMSLEDIVDFVAVSESTPGAFSVNIATYVGTETSGIPGALFATLGVVMPSFLIILMVAKFYDKFKDNRIVKGCMNGLKPAVIGLIGAAVLSIGQTVFFRDEVTAAIFTSPEFYVSAVIFALMIFLGLKKVHPIFIICLSAVIGIAAGYGFGM